MTLESKTKCESQTNNDERKILRGIEQHPIRVLARGLLEPGYVLRIASTIDKDKRPKERKQALIMASIVEASKLSAYGYALYGLYQAFT